MYYRMTFRNPTDHSSPENFEKTYKKNPLTLSNFVSLSVLPDDYDHSKASEGETDDYLLIDDEFVLMEGPITAILPVRLAAICGIPYEDLLKAVEVFKDEDSREDYDYTFKDRS